MTGDRPEPAPLPEVALPAPAPAARAMAGTAFAGFVRGAVLEGPGAAASAARIARAGAEAEAAARAYRPGLSLSLDAAVNQAAGVGSQGLVPALRLAQVLFDGGAGKRLSEAAAARLRGSEADQAAVLARLALEVVEAMAALELARREADLAAADLSAHAALLDGIVARAAAGAGTEGEVLTARGRLAAAEAAAIGARGSVAAAQARLDEIAGAAGPPPPLPEAPRLAPVPIGGAATPDLAARRAALAAAEAEHAAAAARRLPVAALNLSATRSTEAGEGETLAGSIGFDHALDTTGARRGAEAAAAARLAEAQADLLAAERAAERANRQAAEAQATAVLAAQAAARAAEAERAAFAATETEVSLGRRPTGALLDARRDLTAAERALARADSALRLAGWRRLALDGAILSALGLPLPGAGTAVTGAAAP